MLLLLNVRSPLGVLLDVLHQLLQHLLVFQLLADGDQGHADVQLPPAQLVLLPRHGCRLIRGRGVGGTRGGRDGVSE
jgi:hypothetical protein